MLHQVEFLIEGYLLPPTMGTLRVSDKLILEKVWRTGSEPRLSHETSDYAIAYVGTPTPKETRWNFFLVARDYLDFFLLIYSLVSNQRVIARTGIGTTIDDMSSLGAKRIGWAGFQKVHVQHEGESDFLNKPILEAKKRFLLLLPDRQRIMESSLGLALKFYYFARLARQWEEVIIHLTIAAEALLCTNTTEIGKNLSRRLSTLIAENDTEKAEISKKMLKLYRLRSGIVHGGGKKPSLVDAQFLYSYFKRAIERGLSLRHLSKEKLVAKLDENLPLINMENF